MIRKEACLIISGGKMVDIDIHRVSADFIIACDSGVDNAERYGIKPDLIVGDFDSISEANLKKMTEKKLNYVRYPKKKDDTDTMIAVKHAIDMGFEYIKIICVFGGRLDHSIANIQAAHYAALRGAVVELIDKDNYAAVFMNAEMEFRKKEGFYLSVFSLSDKSVGVSVSGAEYELSEGELSNSFPLGVSNEFINEKAVVSVKNGCLMVVVASS